MKEFFEENEIIAMQANKSTNKIEEINRLLVELGNAGKGIPFYAIFPGNGDTPITFDGLISTEGVIERYKNAGLDKSNQSLAPVSFVE